MGGANEEVEAVEVDQVVGQVGQDAAGAPPAISAITADPEDGNFVGQVDSNTVWQLLASAQQSTGGLNPPSFLKPPISPVLAEEDQDDAGPWTWSTDGPGCVAVGGEGAGSQCHFPFTFEGVVYQGCAYKPEFVTKKSSKSQLTENICRGSSAPVPPGSLGWCSTKRD